MENIKTFAFMVETLKCLKPQEAGKYNGYVGVYKDINLYPTIQGTYNWEEEEEYILDFHIKVHGGITFDHPSYYKEIPILPLTTIPEDYYENYRIIGFDTCHLDDTSEIWNYDTVKEETLKLKEQIDALINK